MKQLQRCSTLATLGLVLTSILGLGCTGAIISQFTAVTGSPQFSVSETATMPEITLTIQEHPTARVYVLTIPPSAKSTVQVAVVDSLATVADIAQQTGAIAVVNAGFFDPHNGETTSYGLVAGELVADPAQNERLMTNPSLTTYLAQILNRSEFRRYTCDGQPRYEITEHDAATPSSCQLQDAIGAGPQLVPADTSVAEGFVTYSQGQRTRDALGSTTRNARTAVGIKPNGDVVWVMVAQKPDQPVGTGMTLEEVAEVMRSQGVNQALNLDGGSSSSLYYQGNTYYGKVDANGQAVQRPIKSVLLVYPPSM